MTAWQALVEVGKVKPGQKVFIQAGSVRSKAKMRGVNYSFLFMHADGGQLSQLGKLFESQTLRPVIDRVFPFDATNDALAYVEAGRAKGKVVIKVAD